MDDPVARAGLQLVIEADDEEVQVQLREKGRVVGWVTLLPMSRTRRGGGVDSLERSCRRAMDVLERRSGLPLDAWMVLESEILGRFQGKGLGTAMYRRAAEEAARKDAMIVPNGCLDEGNTSPMAKGAWARMAKLPGMVSAGRTPGRDLVVWAGTAKGSRVRTGPRVDAPPGTWFAGSVVVDRSGQPLRLYRAVQDQHGPNRRDGASFWTDELEVAEMYAHQAGSSRRPDIRVLSGWLNLKKPFILEDDRAARRFAAWLGVQWDGIDPYFFLVDRDEVPAVLRARGYDGMRFEDQVMDDEEGESRVHTSWLALAPQQVWSDPAFRAAGSRARASRFR